MSRSKCLYTARVNKVPKLKSEITKAGKTIGVRLTPNEYEAYMEIGGIKWLRPFLKDHYKLMVETNAAKTIKNPNQNELDLS